MTDHIIVVALRSTVPDMMHGVPEKPRCVLVEPGSQI